MGLWFRAKIANRAKAARKRNRARIRAGAEKARITVCPTPRETRLRHKRDIEDSKQAIRAAQLANHM